MVWPFFLVFLSCPFFVPVAQQRREPKWPCLFSFFFSLTEINALAVLFGLWRCIMIPRARLFQTKEAYKRVVGRIGTSCSPKPSGAKKRRGKKRRLVLQVSLGYSALRLLPIDMCRTLLGQRVRAQEKKTPVPTLLGPRIDFFVTLSCRRWRLDGHCTPQRGTKRTHKRRASRSCAPQFLAYRATLFSQ
nr:hypothetical protein [Pandoravirus massiliensis]